MRKGCPSRAPQAFSHGGGGAKSALVSGYFKIENRTDGWRSLNREKDAPETSQSRMLALGGRGSQASGNGEKRFSQQRGRHAAVGEDGIVEAAQVKACALPPLDLAAQRDQSALADHAGHRLGGRKSIAAHLGPGVRLLKPGLVLQELCGFGQAHLARMQTDIQ